MTHKLCSFVTIKGLVFRKNASFREKPLFKMKIFEIFDIKEKITNLPFHEFEFTDEIAVNKLIIEWKSASAKAFGLVSTDLIIKSSANPRQQICTFVKLPKTSITEVEFNKPVFNQLQQQYLQNSTISIETMFDKPIPEIKHIYLQIITK